MTDAIEQNEPKKRKRIKASGYRGVSWHKAAGKWGAYIRVDGKRRYLGLFATADEAHAAYLEVEKTLPRKADPLSPDQIRAELLDTVHSLYGSHGIQALSTTFLERQKGRLYHRLLAAGLPQAELLIKLSLEAEYSVWRDSSRTYRGLPRPKWTWERAIAVAQGVKDREGDLPTGEWFRRNGHSSMASAVFRSGHTWEDLRDAVGCFATSRFCESRNGMRWLSRPEASFSNFLYARGVEHKRGERYAAGYSEQSGRHSGRHDMHFRSTTGDWIDVEIWGDLHNSLSHGRYQETRSLKEKWQLNNPNFLGVPYRDCLSDAKLTEILKPYIGVIEAFQFDKPQDRVIETAHWSDADELLETCRQVAAQMPDGVFPTEEWLRKRGRYSERPGREYNTIAIRVTQWLGGTRKVRELLGQSHASTISWTPELVIAAWRDFQATHGLTPSQCKGPKRQELLSAEVVTEANKIYEAARRLNVLDIARSGRSARKIIWTQEYALEAWDTFFRTHGRTPSECMSSAQRAKLPRAVTDEATRIYGAVSRFGVLEVARTRGRADNFASLQVSPPHSQES